MSAVLGDIFQQGYIVPDARKNALEWVERVGAGSFYVLDSLKMDQYYYRGVRTDVEMRLVFGYWGNVQIELIQPLSTGLSLYTDALATSPGALNHCATLVSDLDRTIEERRLKDRVIQWGSMATGLKFVYLENYLPDGSHLELIQATEAAIGGFKGMRAVSSGWNGDNPVRPITDLGADLAALQRL